MRYGKATIIYLDGSKEEVECDQFDYSNNGKMLALQWFARETKFSGDYEKVELYPIDQLRKVTFERILYENKSK